MNILLVDDDEESRTSVGDFLREMGHYVFESSNGEDALAAFTSEIFHMVLSDIKMPRMSGIELLRSIAKLPSGKEADFVLFTGHGDMNSAIEALRSGAYEYLLKPINVEELAFITERIAEHQALLRQNKVLTERFNDELQAATEETKQELLQLKKKVAKTIGLSGIGVFSDSIQEIVNMAQKYHTDRSIPVFIEGETGTGKEVVARLIHYGSMEEISPFVDINCAAITPNLFESELFGYEAGAFTGGLTKGQKGKFDIAQGGTIFLDEVAEIPLALQGKLLRVLQEKEFYRVGGLKKVKTDVRVICATNVNIEKRVTEGTFREDLYFRLKVGQLVVPPLRERKEEIISLATMFLNEFSQVKGKHFSSVLEEAGKTLKAYSWPGNVRELRNAMEWVVFMYDDVALKPAHLGILNRSENISVKEIAASSDDTLNPDSFSLPDKGFSLEEYINNIVIKALKLHKGNKTEAARYLGISRRSLYCRLEHLKDNTTKQLG